MVRQMQDQEMAIAIRDLKTYARKDWEMEIGEQTIKDINSLPEQDALWYIQNLRDKPWQVRATRKNQMDVSGIVITMDTFDCHLMKALIDSGCTGSCINKEFVEKHGLNMIKPPKSIPVFNADGSNIAGWLTHMVQLQMIIGNHKEIMELGVSNLGTSDIFLGHDWLKHHNPEIDWKGKTIEFNCCPGSCYKEELGTDLEDNVNPLLEEGERLLAVHLGPEEINIRTKMTYSTEIASAKKDTRTIEEILPKHCHLYWDVFEKQTFNKLPPQHPWDHAIELVEGVKALDCKIYLLSKEEQTQLEEFLKENLETNQIRPIKIPIASPFFFVKKKDGKLRPMQDYWKLNEMMIKNRCKDYFAADVGHVRRRDSVVSSRSWGWARRREGRPRSAVGDEERERETRRAQKRNWTSEWGDIRLPSYVHGYVLYTLGLEAPMWYVQGGTVAVRTVGLGTRNSEFGTRSSSR